MARLSFTVWYGQETSFHLGMGGLCDVVVRLSFVLSLCPFLLPSICLVSPTPRPYQ